MPSRYKPTWVAVMDGTRARFFALRRGEEGQIFEETAGPLYREGRPDKFKEGKAKELDGAQFARQVAATLDGALADKKYDQLVLVAPARHLAELREHLTARVRAVLAHQVPKNLTGLSTDALWEKLAIVLLKAARPVNGAGERVPTVSGNSLPVSVVFRNMAPSPTVQVAALKYAAKLGRKFGRIQNCRVTIDAPKHAHRKVKEFHVAIDLRLPGHEIATKSSSADGASPDDIGIALREAFGTAMRQLQDHVKRLKAGTVRERRRASARVRGLAA